MGWMPCASCHLSLLWQVLAFLLLPLQICGCSSWGAWMRMMMLFEAFSPCPAHGDLVLGRTMRERFCPLHGLLSQLGFWALSWFALAADPAQGCV